MHPAGAHLLCPLARLPLVGNGYEQPGKSVMEIGIRMMVMSVGKSNRTAGARQLS
jgi:hypothetical protein